ncbi:MAG: hypothetical protein QOK23_4672 [Gammaproteobacteria bacterium]|nr:hypothetical protein [Gammaproteobacteria bacterium]
MPRRCSGTVERFFDDCQKLFVAEGFGKQRKRACPQGLRMQVSVAILLGRDERNRDIVAGRRQVSLQLEAAHAGQLHIENQARDLIAMTGF